ncbi:MAG: hypothetical protein V4505_05390 [Pseudomonadota bacterium]
MRPNNKPRTPSIAVENFLKIFVESPGDAGIICRVAERHGNLPNWAIKDPLSYWRDLEQASRGSEIHGISFELPVGITPWRQKDVADWLVGHWLNGRPYHYILLSERRLSVGEVRSYAHFLVGPRQSKKSGM